MTETARDLYSAGRLEDAIAAATAEVRGRPSDQSARGFLAELLCLNGDMERADKQFDALGTQDDKAVPALVVVRHVLRAEQARQQFFKEGHVPTFFDQPTAAMRHGLEASISIREGALGEAAELLRKAEAARPPVTGTCNGEPFAEFRDLDDLTAGLFEVLTAKGDYYWVPFERVERIEFRAPARPRDLMWRRALMGVRDGPEGEVFIPAIYPLTYEEQDDGLRLGRVTDWKELDGGLVRGLGLRTFLVGEGSKTIMELEELTFEPAGQ